MKRFIPTSQDRDLLYQSSTFSHSLYPIQTFGRGAPNISNGSIAIPRGWYQTPSFDG